MSVCLFVCFSFDVCLHTKPNLIDQYQRDLEKQQMKTNLIFKKIKSTKHFINVITLGPSEKKLHYPNENESTISVTY